MDGGGGRKSGAVRLTWMTDRWAREVTMLRQKKTISKREMRNQKPSWPGAEITAGCQGV